jgi:hypothetical protein
MIIFAAIEKVAIQGDDGSLLIPKKALVAAMLATKDLAGLTGNLTCTEPTATAPTPRSPSTSASTPIRPVGTRVLMPIATPGRSGPRSQAGLTARADGAGLHTT